MQRAGESKEEGVRRLSFVRILVSFKEPSFSRLFGWVWENPFEGARSSPQKNTDELVSESASSAAVPLTLPFLFALRLLNENLSKKVWHIPSP